MVLPVLLLLADPQSAVEAERAFNRAAQTQGQWTAFRATSTDDAIWFIPQPTKVHDSLPPKDPPIAVQWWPAESYVSCDRTMAVNTGPWVRPGSVGYFTTVWKKQADGGWKWTLDHGAPLPAPRALPEKPRVRTASCSGRARPPIMGADVRSKYGSDLSADATLSYRWEVDPDGARLFFVEFWNGKEYEIVIEDKVAAPAK